MREKKWFRGDCHLHTTNSDGKKNPEALYEMLYRRGLDFAFITDHNYNTVGDKRLTYKGITIIPGLEITGGLGHVNVWGENIPIKSIERPETEERYNELLDIVRGVGGTISINHPHDRRFGWDIGLDKTRFDCVELWNSPMHTDNVYCRDWWHGELLKGRYVPAVGGSDYHEDYLHLTHLLASPCTYVYAESNSMEDIINGIRGGHVFVTNAPSSAGLFLTCGDAVPGDTVAFNGSNYVQVRISHLRRRQTLRIWCNDEIIYTLSAPADKGLYDIFESIRVPEKGFVRAEVGFRFNKAEEFVYVTAASKLKAHNEGEPVPEMYLAFTNPIFFK